MIEVMGLSKHFENLEVFKDLSFLVNDNEGMFIVGASGCGKTTLLRLIAGFDDDYQGKMRIDGRLVNQSVAPGERDVAIVFQEPTLWNHMTVEKNMSYGMKDNDRDRLVEVARGLEISELLNKYPEQISGGQAKRVSLARALLSGKKNLLLDEPLSNVDQKTKDVIMDFLRTDYLSKRCIIYVTHDSKEIERLPFKIKEM